MRTLSQLIVRNMKVYLRNRSNVFFSFLTMFIILLLNTVFLGGINEDHLSGILPIEDRLISYITGSWLMSGLIVVNAFMVTSIMLGIMVEDEEKHRLIAFMVAPISRMTLALSYIIAAFMMSFCFALFTLGISLGYLWWQCHEMISFVNILKIIGFSMGNNFSVVSIMMCVATLMKSSSSFGAFNTTMGTIIGFIAGIYLPIGSLPETVQNILKLFPILHGTALIREIYTEEAITKGFVGTPLAVVDEYKQYMGITIYVGDEKLNLWMSLVILLGSGLIFMILAALLVSKKQTSDR